MLITAFVPACTDKFEEINTNPNALTSTPHTNVLGNCIRRMADQIGNDIDGFGMWAGYIAKLQYPDDMSGVNPDNNGFGNRWSQCYRDLEQLRLVLEKTEETAAGHKNLRLVCRIWQNYMWLCLLDQYGDIPYSEALRGREAFGGILTPKYDSEREVYPDVLNKLKALADEMAAGFGDDELGEGDFLFGEDMELWQRFCNSIRLRGAMRISAVWPNAKAYVEEIAGNPGKYPLIESNDENAYFRWAGSAPYWDSWYANFRGRDDHCFYDTFIDHMLAMEDPRIASIAKLAKKYTAKELEDDKSLDPDATTYRGYQNGLSAPSENARYSRIGVMYRETPAGFTPFYKSCETFYMLAEAAMRGWNVKITAEEAYETAVYLSMEDNKIDEEAADEYLAGNGAWDGTIERIWWDQWVALFKENMEAWCLYRRTGIPTPDVNYVSTRSKYGSAHTSQPFRVPYPWHDASYNAENCKKANEGVVDFAWGKQLWWDTRKGVK